jgi:hypothetical protein
MDRDALAKCTPDELARTMGQLHGLMAAAHAELLDAVAVYDLKQDWTPDGATSMAYWLVATFGLSNEEAADWVRVAHAIVDLPAIAATYREGRMSWAQLREVTKFANPETDAVIAEDAVRYSASYLRRIARRSRPKNTEGDNEAHRDRSFRMRWDTARDILKLSGQLPGPEGAVVQKIVEKIASQAPPDPHTRTFEAWDARCADALVELASTKLAGEAEADRAHVVVHVDADALKGQDAYAEVIAGPALCSEAARRLACDSRWQVIVDGPNGLPIGIGRTSRKVPKWLSRELNRRDVGCRFPGCNRKRWVAAHHILHWANGGPTNIDNLITLCAYHHRLVHEGDWTVRGNPNGDVVFIRPDGRPYDPGPEPLQDDLRRRFFDDGPGGSPEAASA